MSGSSKKKVCVIGCGPAGMSMLFQLGKLPDDEIPEIICYEKQDTVGGMWNISWRTGVDQYGEQNHSYMYHDLWINGPKEQLEYPDYTYEKHFGKLLPSYAPRAVVRDYIEGRFTHGADRDLKQFVRFATVVRRVKYNKTTDDFTVIAENLKEKREDIQRFTHVVVCVGVYGSPFAPDVPGIDGFPGRVLHSKDVKRISEFKGQRILLIGNSLSGDDLALIILKFGAKSVILSYKYRPTGFKWPEGIVERPLVVKFQEDTVYFKDGSMAEVDVVILCTGYLMEFPFLSEELRVRSKNQYYPEGLYKGILKVDGGNDKCMYVGLQYNLYSFNLYEAQAVWVCKNIMGALKLPPRDEMLAEIVQWGKKIKDAAKNHVFGEVGKFMGEYFRNMVESAGYGDVVLELLPLLAECLKHRVENICTARDKQFRCIFTGKLAPPPKAAYMENFDDSLQTYICQY